MLTTIAVDYTTKMGWILVDKNKENHRKYKNNKNKKNIDNYYKKASINMLIAELEKGLLWRLKKVENPKTQQEQEDKYLKRFIVKYQISKKPIYDWKK